MTSRPLRTRRQIPGWLVVPLTVWLVFVAGHVIAQDDEDRVGSDTCEACHDEVAAAFKDSVHWHNDPEGSCENCHGSGAAHADEMDPTLIRRFVPETAANERSAACLSCHGRNSKHGTFTRSDHALGSVVCNDCHKVHEATLDSSLRKESPALCYECHAPIRAQFSLNERHPVNQGGLDCSDCHDVHAPSPRGTLAGFKQEMCLSCHNEYRGPWFFEHEAVTVEGCLSCHTPHGSANRHLLTYQRAGDLCLQCHAEQPFFHDLTDTVVDPDNPTAPPRDGRFTGINDCTRCHAEIHGSNNDALFLN